MHPVSTALNMVLFLRLTTLDASGSLCGDAVADFVSTSMPTLERVSFDSWRSMSRALRAKFRASMKHFSGMDDDTPAPILNFKL